MNWRNERGMNEWIIKTEILKRRKRKKKRKWKWIRKVNKEFKEEKWAWSGEYEKMNRWNEQGKNE